MRRLFARIEVLAPAPFILLVGLISGALQGIPALILGGTSATWQRVQFPIVATSAALWWSGAVLLLFAAIRRCRFSVLSTVLQIVLALIVGDLLTSGLGLVSASFQTRGAFAGYLARAPLQFLWGFAAPSLVRSVIRFAIFAVAVTLGRRLLEKDPPVGSRAGFIVVILAASLPLRAQSAPRCYRLEIGAWHPKLGANEPYHRLPTVIRLDTLAWPSHGRHLEPRIAYPYRKDFPGTPSWAIVGDTLRLVWSNGFSPTVVTMVRRGAEWIGTALAESDAHSILEPPPPRASVTAHPMACAGFR